MASTFHQIVIVMSILLLLSSQRCYSFGISTSKFISKYCTRQYALSTPLIIDGAEIRYAMAPMVANSDYAFRKLIRTYSSNENHKNPVILGYTQMILAKSLLKDKTYRQTHVDFGPWDGNLLPCQQACREGMETVPLSRDEGGPLMVQLAGDCPSTVVAAAESLLSTGITGIDFNLGCPQNIARKGNYGAFLMEKEEDLVFEILTKLRLKLPEQILVSAKIRLPLEGTTVLKRRMAKLVDTGINFVTIHGRTLKENKVAVGACHFDQIQYAVDYVHTTLRPEGGFPIISNGGIEYHECIQSVFSKTGASAVMSSEALLETPNLFAVPTMNMDPRTLFRQQLQFARDYIAICAQYPPLSGTNSPQGGSFSVARGHLLKFLHRYLSVHVDLRTRLTDSMPWNLGAALALLDELESRYPKHVNVEQNCGTSWYLRHRSGQDRIHRKGGESHTLSLQERKQSIQERIQKLQYEKQVKKGQITV
jgi:tRNA-dihydrouridine synthase